MKDLIGRRITTTFRKMIIFKWSRRLLLVIGTGLLLLRVSVSASSPSAPVEEQARAVLDKFGAALKAKNTDAIFHLLSKDCTFIMLEGAGVSARARFYTRDTYLELLKERLSGTSAANSNRVIRKISSGDNGDVFITMDNE